MSHEVAVIPSKRELPQTVSEAKKVNGNMLPSLAITSNKPQIVRRARVL